MKFSIFVFSITFAFKLAELAKDMNDQGMARIYQFARNFSWFKIKTPGGPGNLIPTVTEGTRESI